MDLAVTRGQADAGADRVVGLAGHARGDEAEARHLDVEHRVGAEMFGMADGSRPGAIETHAEMFGPDPDGGGADARRRLALDEVHRRRADETRHEAVGGAAIEVEGAADLLDDAGPHDHDLVRQGHGLDLVVGDIDHGGAELPVQLGDFEPRADPERGIEVRQRLVEEEEARLAHDGPADGDALALPTGQFGGAALEQRVELQQARGLGDTRGDRLLAETFLLQRQAHVPRHREMRV